MAKKYNAAASKWSDLDAELSEANIVIGSASCQGYLFTKDQLEKIMKNRRDNALLVIDIAVPRNFEPTVNGIENIYLYSIDELSAVADDNRKARETDLTSAMQIVYDAAAEFMSWFRGRDIGVLIGLMKENFGKISGDELDRFFVGKRKDADCRAVAETMVNRIVSRLSHCVIENVDEVARIHGNAEAAKMLDGIIQQAQQIAEGQKHQEADPDEN